MRVQLCKGKPRNRTDWSQLESAITKLRHGNHLRVHPDAHVSVKALRARIAKAYEGVTVLERKNYVIVMLNGDD